MILYDHPGSANCLKVRILLRQLGIWSTSAVTVDLFTGETRRPEHLARNPDGRVPVLELDSGELIPESAAILLYLAEGTPFLPSDRLERARVHQWLFFEQNQVEAGLAVARFMAADRAGAEEAGGVRRPAAAGAQRAASRWSAGWSTTVRRGRALHASPTSRSTATCTAPPTRAPTRASTRAIAAWLDRVEATPGFENDLEPISWTDS